LLISNDADADLELIADYVSRDNSSAAIKLMRSLIDRFMLLANQPMSGEVRNDLRRGLRCVAVGNYVIFFEPLPDGVRILRVIHGARDLRAAIESKPL
jgi:toxin ParE1/3/4